MSEIKVEKPAQQIVLGGCSTSGEFNELEFYTCSIDGTGEEVEVIVKDGNAFRAELRTEPNTIYYDKTVEILESTRVQCIPAVFSFARADELQRAKAARIDLSRRATEILERVQNNPGEYIVDAHAPPRSGREEESRIVIKGKESEEVMKITNFSIVAFPNGSTTALTKEAERALVLAIVKMHALHRAGNLCGSFTTK